MSAIIKKSKKIYRTALLAEILCLILIFILFLIFKKEWTMSFVFGAISCFIPNCIIVYWMFFKQKKNSTDELGHFYKGEILKWVMAISLISIFLVYFNINVFIFLMGYIFSLLANNFIPIWLYIRTK